MIITACIAFIACIAAVIVVPEVRQWLKLDKNIQVEYPILQNSSTVTLLPGNIKTETQIPYILVTSTQNYSITDAPTTQSPISPIGNEKISDSGSKQLVLMDNQVAIGTADKFQDVINDQNPKFTIFVIYGSINVEITLFWGGWDIWQNANEKFIENQILNKI